MNDEQSGKMPDFGSVTAIVTTKVTGPITSFENEAGSNLVLTEAVFLPPANIPDLNIANKRRDYRKSTAAGRANVAPAVIRHLTWTTNSWIYQPRVPKLLSNSTCGALLKTRIGPATVLRARRIAALLDGLAESLFAAGMEWKNMLDLRSVAGSMSEAEMGFMLVRMSDAFHGTVDEIIDNGYDNPLQGNVIINRTISQFNQEIAEFDKTAIGRRPEAMTIRKQLRSGVAQSVARNETVTNDTALNILGGSVNSAEELADILMGTGTGSSVLNAGMAAFWEIVSDTDAFKKYKHDHANLKAELVIRAEQAVQRLHELNAQRAPAIIGVNDAQVSIEATDFSGAAVNQPASPIAQPDALNAPVIVEAAGQATAPVVINGAVAGSDAVGQVGEPSASGVVDKPAEMFLGQLDPRFIVRPASTTMTFSAALEKYVSTRERRSGLLPGASLPKAERDALGLPSYSPAQTRDLTTLRHRAKMFITLVGDYPLDTYLPEDFETFVECLRYVAPNASWAKFDEAGGLHAYINSNRDAITGEPTNNQFVAGSVRDGLIAGLRPIWRQKTRSAVIHDPVANANIAYGELFGGSNSREVFGDAQMARMIEEGINRQSLAHIMLPILGHMTTRRLAALVSLKGCDIEQVHEPYGDNKSSVYGVKIGSWTAADGTVVNPRLKTELSKRHFLLHDVFYEIGFTQWLQTLGNEHVFASLHRASDPDGQASKMMGRFLAHCGAKNGQVFHSFRHAGILMYRHQLSDDAATRHQAGHAASDEHARYGGSVLPEYVARKLVGLQLPCWLQDALPELKKLDFEQLRQNDLKNATHMYQTKTRETPKIEET